MNRFCAIGRGHKENAMNPVIDIEDMSEPVHRARTSWVVVFWICAIGLLVCTAAAQAVAQTSVQPVIYPAKGQSAKQQDQDRYECHAWARGQSGYDPTLPTQGVPAGQSVAVIQRVKQNQAAQQQQAKQLAAQQQAAQQQATASSQQRATYERALGACMEGRGYTVK